ncbi:hypothetical protein Tco_0220170 [Tanacetum coccineum]
MGIPMGSTIWALEVRIDVAMAHSSWAWSWECLLIEPSTGDTLTSDRSLNKYSTLAAGRIGYRSLGVGSGSSLSVCSIPCNRCCRIP